MTPRTLAPEMICSLTSVDPRDACGPATRVREVWRIGVKDAADHHVFIGDRGRPPYCEFYGFDCCCVAAVLQKRAAGVLADQP